MSDKDKLKLYERLGARKMQKFVFKLEKYMYKFMHRFMPNHLVNFEKRLDKRLSHDLSRTTDSNKREELKNIYFIKKVLAREEWNNSQNINYHVHLNPTIDFTKFLNYNKNIHKKGIRNNIILLSIGSILLILPIGLDIPLIILNIVNIFSLGINTECVILQNYNIIRYNKVKDKIQKKAIEEEKKIDDKYGNGLKVMANMVKNNNYDIAREEKLEDLENLKEYIDNILKKKEGKKL